MFWLQPDLFLAFYTEHRNDSCAFFSNCMFKNVTSCWQPLMAKSWGCPLWLPECVLHHLKVLTWPEVALQMCYDPLSILGSDCCVFLCNLVMDMAGEEEGKEREQKENKTWGKRPWCLMLFHKAADAPSNSINSLAPTEWHRLSLHQNDIREFGGLFFFTEIPVMSSLIPNWHGLSLCFRSLPLT